MSKHYDCIVIGGGASGFFAAIQAAKGGSNSVLILEKTSKLLSKVKVSGGGRCNVTHAVPSVKALSASYPRGGKSLLKAFMQFDQNDTIEWFQSRSVPLKTEEDGRIFPFSNQSQSIIDALLKEANQQTVEIQTKVEVLDITQTKKGYSLKASKGVLSCTYLVLATGGFPKESGYDIFKTLGLSHIPTVPSLFTFNVKKSPAKHLMGLSVPNGAVRIPGSNWKQEGPLLITHWGFSAPAVILLSAWAALDLYQRSYQFPIEINWVNQNEAKAREVLLDFAQQHRLKHIHKLNPFNLPSRLWHYLCARAEIKEGQQWHDVSKKALNKLVKHLVSDPYAVNGKTTFKEEFVRCGGIDLNELNLKTFECTRFPNLFAVGEVINVDGITGGFNFQHAWTSGYLAGSEIARRT
jgi:predicted Rossmann fold flavoprotein